MFPARLVLHTGRFRMKTKTNSQAGHLTSRRMTGAICSSLPPLTKSNRLKRRIMTKGLGVEQDHWKDTMNIADRLAMRFPSAGANVSLGELSHGSFLPCTITESSEIFVSSDHAYDLTLGKACRVDAMQAYVRYLHRAGDEDRAGINWFELEGVYNRVTSACNCGIPQGRMAQDLSNLRTYWLPRLCKPNVCS